MWLGTFYQGGILTLLPLDLGADCRLSLSTSQKPPILLALPLLPAWILANQHFIKAIQVTNLYKVQDHCPTAMWYSDL